MPQFPHAPSRGDGERAPWCRAPRPPRGSIQPTEEPVSLRKGAQCCSCCCSGMCHGLAGENGCGHPAGEHGWLQWLRVLGAAGSGPERGQVSVVWGERQSPRCPGTRWGTWWHGEVAEGWVGSGASAPHGCLPCQLEGCWWNGTAPTACARHVAPESPVLRHWVRVLGALPRFGVLGAVPSPVPGLSVLGAMPGCCA